MPYRLHATKRSLYKLTADKIADLPWCELPKINEVEFVSCRSSYFLRWPYHEVFFSTLPDAPVISITQYDHAPSDNSNSTTRTTPMVKSKAITTLSAMIPEITPTTI